MNYKKTLIQLLIELENKEGYAVRNIRLKFDGNVYNMIISVLDFGQRIEIKGTKEEYFIFVRGIQGLEAEGIVHSKNAEAIVKMMNRFSESITKEILNAPNYINENFYNKEDNEIYTIEIPKKLLRNKSEKEISNQMDRLLDRYNDYLYLYHDPLLTDEKYLRKALKIMKLMKKKVFTK